MKKELKSFVNSSNMKKSGTNYISQKLEFDAFAFTKYYLEKFEGINVTHPSGVYESLIKKNIITNINIM